MHNAGRIAPVAPQATDYAALSIAHYGLRDGDGIEPALRMSEQLGALDDARISSVPRAAVRSRHAEDGRCRVAPAHLGVFDPRTRADTNSEANRSPVPEGLIGSFGVRTRQA